ncbi:citrate synthase/methylcitrate synthase [Planococcus sp. N028]|uniref:Citrate synthase n=1 Tax=Planococcus shixiaomingii TaxID=3058393 RepID=A0ABT8N567_9BACL|nr:MULTISPECIES: citrate synthase/methylcitrate synthase [unclassified Planococcus (in: firmicutes)]MDN7243028.1 citrate synthase/methylcitrate synthase [Planococcus sp. N028]WKA54970.1 citrate synthase/methylcitrate synthase [Planococcus sp. N022]
MFQKGLKDVVAVQTSIASVDGDRGELRYRGQRVDEVIEGRSFEETAYFLWHGRFPSAQEAEELTEQLIRYRLLPPHIIEMAQLLPPGSSVMDSLRTLVSAFTHHMFTKLPSAEQAVAITAALPVLTAMVYRFQKGEDIIQPRNDLGHTANYLWMLDGLEPSAAQVEALETYLKLTMEHGMNASTFAARVTISTESDLASAITSALGTMKGPLHGGAPSGVIDLLDEIGNPENISQVILSKLEKGEKIMGFGHRVYRTEDPRSIILREKCLALQGKDPWLDLAVVAETEIIRLLNAHKPGRALYTNVEFYAAAIMRSIDMPSELFTPTFSIARIVGWTAHALEQQQDNVIFRPQSEYIGNN